MSISTHNLSSRVIIACIFYMAITALFLTGSLNTFLNRLAQTQLNELGRALSAQLTETLKQPVINHDVISIQVILDNLLADTPAIARATVYSTSNRILAQSQRLTASGTTLSPYIRAVNVDDNMLAQLRLELDEDQLFAEYRHPMWVSVGIWLLSSAVLCLYIISLARNYSGRIARLNAGFSHSQEQNIAELALLESSLSPFISEPADEENEDEDENLPTSFAMLAVSIPNLPKWQAQLNADHFTGMLGKVDELIDNHLALYKGVRIHSRNTAMLLQFDDLADGHPIQRAVDCANALLQFANQLISSQNIPFEVRVTAAYRHPSIAGSPWYTDLEREECMDRLLDILPLAGAWELIIDKDDLDANTDLEECELEDLNAASVWQFRHFTGHRQDEFYKQLDFLSATLK